MLLGGDLLLLLAGRLQQRIYHADLRSDLAREQQGVLLALVAACLVAVGEDSTGLGWRVPAAALLVVAGAGFAAVRSVRTRLAADRAEMLADRRRLQDRADAAPALWGRLANSAFLQQASANLATDAIAIISSMV